MQPLLLGLTTPMYNGTEILKSTGEEVVIIRYEKVTGKGDVEHD